MSRAVRKCEKPEHCSGFSMWCGMAGTLPGGYLRPGLRMPDSQLPMPDFFFLRRLGFSGSLGASRFPFVPGGFRISGFAPILSPSRVCGRCGLPVRLLPAPVAVTASCRPCRGVLVLRLLPVRGLLAAGSLPLRFRVAGSLSLRFAPARPLSGLTLCGLFLCGSLFLRLLLPSGLCCIRFFPGGLFPAVLCGSQFPGIRVEFQPGQFEDVFQQRAFLLRAEGDGLSVAPGASRAADAVDIGLGHFRQVVVDYQRQFADVDSPRGDVGGDQHPAGPRAKVIHGAFAGAL